MNKTIMDNCVHFNHSEEDPDSIRVICPYCYHETWFNFSKEVNRCTQCTIIINEEDIYDLQPED